MLTIHNVAFQGNFAHETLPLIGIPDDLFRSDGVEFYGRLSFLKTAIRFSDYVTTVSPTYAREIVTPEFGCGMDGVLRVRADSFSGILNGIDTDCWNPATDPCLAQTYDPADMAGKRTCKAELQRELGLETSCSRPLIGFASRLTHQKMADIVLSLGPLIVELGAQFVLLGEGESTFEAGFKQLSEQYRGSIAARTRYDEALAHRLHAGADILLAPARFEPCGLTQMYASRYGTLPIVRKTGGLADTVIDVTPTTLLSRTATGFLFGPPTSSALLGTIDHALTLYGQPLIWRRLRHQAMSRDFSWSASAAKYIALYRKISGTGCSPRAELSPSQLVEERLDRQAVT